MGSGRGADRGSRIRWLRSHGDLGRSPPAEGLGADHGTDHRHWCARDRLDLVSASSGQRKRPFATRLHWPGRAFLLLVLLVLKPAATILCMRSGAPGGMFTPSLTFGAVLGGVLGLLWSHFWPGAQPGIFALLGAGAVLGATTQGPISAVVLMMELTGRDRSFILPLLLVVGIATLVARSVDARSIYDARLTDEEIEQRQKQRDLPSQEASAVTAQGSVQG